jgi:hypothetical protein
VTHLAESIKSNQLLMTTEVGVLLSDKEENQNPELEELREQIRDLRIGLFITIISLLIVITDFIIWNKATLSWFVIVVLIMTAICYYK